MSSYSVVASRDDSNNNGDGDEDYNKRCHAQQRTRPRPQSTHRQREEIVTRKIAMSIYGNSTENNKGFDEVVKHAGAPLA